MEGLIESDLCFRPKYSAVMFDLLKLSEVATFFPESIWFFTEVDLGVVLVWALWCDVVFC